VSIKRRPVRPAGAQAEFDAIFGRVRRRKLAYWADPGMKQAGEINKHYGGWGKW